MIERRACFINNKIFGDIFLYLLSITDDKICAKNFYIKNSYGDAICSRSTFYSWKSGKYIPKNIITIEQICKLFGESIYGDRIIELRNYILNYPKLKLSEIEKERIIKTINSYEIIFIVFEKLKLESEILSKSNEVNSQKEAEENNNLSSDKTAAWELFVELSTRICTQKLEWFEGDEIAALNSIHKLFDITREILKKYGQNSVYFTEVALIILNKAIRPFTSKWHRISKLQGLEDIKTRKLFRKELIDLQKKLIIYAKQLIVISEAKRIEIDDIIGENVSSVECNEFDREFLLEQLQ
jgi:hypothetical protein